MDYKSWFIEVQSCWDKFYHQLAFFFFFPAFSSITLGCSSVGWYNTTLLEKQINDKIYLPLLTLNMPFSFTVHHSLLFSTLATLKMPRYLLRIHFQTIRKKSNVAVCMEQSLSPGIKWHLQILAFWGGIFGYFHTLGSSFKYFESQNCGRGLKYFMPSFSEGVLPKTSV